jgi:hypothetical protein
MAIRWRLKRERQRQRQRQRQREGRLDRWSKDEDGNEDKIMAW